MITKGDSEVRILLFGFINMNLMDGSAVFLSGFTSMLAQNPNFKIDLVLACPKKRDILLRAIEELPNVNIISPYEDYDLTESNPEWVKRERMTFDEASYIIEHYWKKNNYDWFFIRGMEIAEELLSSRTTILEKTFVYITGITHENQDLTDERRSKIVNLFGSAAYLVCQTEEMKEFLIERFQTDINEKKIITLNPMIPDTQDDFEQVFNKKESYTKLCYTGKFAFGWNSIPMIVGYRELQEEFPSLTFDIAGDKFNLDKNIPHYVQDLKYLLENTNNLKWYGALTRDESRELIKDCDIGITWRDKSMDSSLELSTKLLEYGSLGKAVIMNPTPMHKKIFGDDYPLFAATLEDYIQVITKIQEDPELYENAARIMFENSKKFTYSQSIKKISPYFTPNNKQLVAFFEKKGFIVPSELMNQTNRKTNDLICKLKFKNNNKSFNKYFSVSRYISNPANIQESLSSISEIGEIEDVLINGDFVIFIVCKTNQGFYKNYFHNSQSKIYIDLIEEIIDEKAFRVAKREYIQSFNKEKNAIKKSNIKVEKNDFQVEKNLKAKLNSKNKEVELLKEQTNKLTAKVNENKKKIEVLNKRLNALRNSKLGKITVKYWSIRNNGKNYNY